MWSGDFDRRVQVVTGGRALQPELRAWRDYLQTAIEIAAPPRAQTPASEIARIFSTISLSAGKRPSSCFEKILVLSTTTLNTPLAPRTSCASIPNSLLSVAAKLEARGR